ASLIEPISPSSAPSDCPFRSARGRSILFLLRRGRRPAKQPVFSKVDGELDSRRSKKSNVSSDAGFRGAGADADARLEAGGWRLEAGGWRLESEARTARF